MRLDTKQKRLDYRAVTAPKNATKVKSKIDDSVAYLYADTVGNPCARIYRGNSAKPCASHYFKSEEKRNDFVARWFDNHKQRHESKANYKASKKATGRGVEVGDLLRASWGYDQTNIDYYQVTKLIGKTMVEVREIGQMIEHTGDMQGDCAPSKDSFIGEPMRKKAVDGCVKIDSVRRASKMNPVAENNGVKVYRSSSWTAYH